MGDRERDPARASDAFVELTTAPTRSLAPEPTVYDDVRRVLLEHGWVRGREHDRHGSVGLVGAIETAVRVSDRRAAVATIDGPQLAREARIARHLRELAGTSNLGAWCDVGARTFDDVLELLSLAASMFPDD